MCTVSYLPTRSGFILTSNRDESPDREISEVAIESIEGQKVYFPKDPLAGGSWFAFSDSGAVSCLLNGAYEPYDRSVVYPLSRGIVLLDSFKYDSANDFATRHQFNGAAPFTMVLERNGAIAEVIWDGSTIACTKLDAGKTHFWSSVTLYPESVRQQRLGLFGTWLKKQENFRQENIIAFHKYGGTGDTDNDFVMNRNNTVKTLSISSVEARRDGYTFKHINLDAPGDNFECQVDKNNRIAPKS